MGTTIRRGDVFYCDYGKGDGTIQSGIRPVLVIQADDINAKSPTIVVAAITNAADRRYLPTHVLLSEETCLRRRSMVMIEQLRSVDRSSLTDFIGVIDDEYVWKEINKAVKKAFGLWIYRNNRAGDIRCLCQNCLNDYKQVNGLIVRRLDPFQSRKEPCDKCNAPGYDYVMYDRKTQINKVV